MFKEKILDKFALSDNESILLIELDKYVSKN